MRAAFLNLSQAERDVILDPKGASKLPENDANKSEMGTISSINDESLLEDPAPKDTTSDMVNGEVVSFRNIFALWNSNLVLRSSRKTLSRNDA